MDKTHPTQLKKAQLFGRRRAQTTRLKAAAEPVMNLEPEALLRNLNSINKELQILTGGLSPGCVFQVSLSEQVALVLGEMQVSQLRLQACVSSVPSIAVSSEAFERAQMTAEDWEQVARRGACAAEAVQKEWHRWKGCVSGDLARFAQNISATLTTYVQFARQYFPAAELTRDLARFQESWTDCHDPNPEGLLLTTAWQAESSQCLRCEALQQELDSLEVLSIAQSAEYQEQLTATKRLVTQLQTEVSDWKSKAQNTLEQVYCETLSRLRTDIENLTGYELPQLQPPDEFLAATRRAVREASTRVKHKFAERDIAEYCKCSPSELETAIQEMRVALAETRRVTKVRLGNASLTIRLVNLRQVEYFPLPSINAFVQDTRAELVAAFSEHVCRLDSELDKYSPSTRLIESGPELQHYKAKYAVLKEAYAALQHRFNSLQANYQTLEQAERKASLAQKVQATYTELATVLEVLNTPVAPLPSIQPL